MLITQILILLGVNIFILLFIVYGIHLHYQDKIESVIDDIEKEYEDIINIINEDGVYKNEIQEKRLYKKYLTKLKKELEEKNLLISYMQKNIRESRLYKKYFITNIKNNYENI